MKIGILGLQGGIYEHYYMVRKVFEKKGLNGEIIIVKKMDKLFDLDGLIIPGGESTTIGVLARRLGLLDVLRDQVINGLPVLGTCAGAIMLAKKVSDRVTGETKQPLIATMNVEIVRNYFGRQRESFELDIVIKGLEDKPFRGVFIRAPAITSYWGSVEPLSTIKYYDEEVVVIARENNILATVFHPELTNDTRIHELFIEMIKK